MDKLLDSAVPPPKIACTICRDFPKVVAVVDRWMERTIDGSIKLSLKDLHRTLRKLYPGLPSSERLRRHCSSCRTENYQKVRDGE